MFQKKTLRAALLLVLISMQLSACSGQAAANPESKPIHEPVSADINFTDAAGREVHLDHKIFRYALIGKATYMPLHLIYMFPNAHEMLVGLESRDPDGSKFLPVLNEEYVEIPLLGTNTNAEEVASLYPDVVFMKGTIEEERAQVLEAFGMKVVYLGLETPQMYFKDIENLGLVFDEQERANEIIDFFQQRLESINSISSQIPDEEKPEVLLLEYSDRSDVIAVQVPALSWMQTLQIKTVGGNPVWLGDAAITDGWTVVNLEQIAVWNPEKIFLVVWHTMDPMQVLEDIKTDPKWAALDAVKNDEVFAFPGDIYGWDTPEPRWILGTMWLAGKMYPDKFPDMDIRQEMNEFFFELFEMPQEKVDELISDMRMPID